jgi:hypothetical protein
VRLQMGETAGKACHASWRPRGRNTIPA